MGVGVTGIAVIVPSVVWVSPSGVEGLSTITFGICVALAVGSDPQLPHPLSVPEGCVGWFVSCPILIPAMVFCTSAGFVSGVTCTVGGGGTVLKKGVEDVAMPARFEILSREPLIIADGAHNPGGLKALSGAIDKYLNSKNIICVMGMLKDKDCKSSLRFLEGKLYKLITTTVKDNPRRQTAEELKETASVYFEDITAEENPLKAVDTALQLAEETDNSAVLVCGSLYLASDIRFYLERIGFLK